MPNMPDETIYLILGAFTILPVSVFVSNFEYFKSREPLNRLVNFVSRGIFIICVILAGAVFLISPESWDRYAKYGTLLPADEPTPPSPCRDVGSITDSHLKIFLGNSLFASSNFPLVVLSFIDAKTEGTEDELVIIDKKDDQLLLTVIVRDEDGNRIAEIEKNNVLPIEGVARSIEWPDKHSVRVKDGPGNIVLEVRYINYNSVTIFGRFRSKGFPTVIVKQGGEIEVGDKQRIVSKHCEKDFGKYGLQIDQYGGIRL